MRTLTLTSAATVLIVLLMAGSCKKASVGPTVTDAHVELFEPFVTASTDGTKPAGSFEWGGRVLNRSRFSVTAGVKLELINPDDVIFFTTREHVVEVTKEGLATFKVEESGVQVPLPVFSSIKDWNMKIRLVSWKVQ